jgi:NAD(P)-dependent dehydrogenase (short-subunit alcohol dehydrogenase family)
LNNKLIMITGANAGIGKVAALELAKQGHHIVMVCRSQERGRAAQAEIKAASGSEQVDLLIADLSVQADIHQLAAEFKQKYERLDVLVNNAGAIFDKRQETADGLELTFALNHMGYFLLTDLLLDVLKASAPPASSTSLPMPTGAAASTLTICSIKKGIQRFSCLQRFQTGQRAVHL